MPLVSESKLGPYEILSPIGAGGMGEVYKAKDTRLGRIVAIKVLPSELSQNPERRERFEREARTVSALSHPNICTLFDIGQQDGIDFLVMEYLEGETLAERLSRGALPIEEALGYAVQLADALDSAHREGVVHRDLKPGNIMLIKPGAKLLDFGLAKPVAAQGASLASELPTKQKPLTEDGVIPGTLPYMAPEQLEGKEADTRTDLFAFGLVLYEMLTGRRAFEGKSPASLIAAILEQEPPPVSRLQPMSPTALDRVVTTCLAKDPDERWQSARDLGRELKWISEGGASETVRPDHRGRERLLATGLAFLAVLTAALTVFYFSGTPIEDRVARLQISPPREGTPYTDSGVSVSPDGRYVAWRTQNLRTIWLRPIDSIEGRELAVATEDSPFFWSPDSRSIGFEHDGKIKVIDISGGAANDL
jgi:serine/threonine protein kinase